MAIDNVNLFEDKRVQMGESSSSDRFRASYNRAITRILLDIEEKAFVEITDPGNIDSNIDADERHLTAIDSGLDYYLTLFGHGVKEDLQLHQVNYERALKLSNMRYLKDNLTDKGKWGSLG